jgi:signal transduction histidine kinase
MTTSIYHWFAEGLFEETLVLQRDTTLMDRESAAILEVMAQDQSSQAATWPGLVLPLRCAWAFLLGAATLGFWRVAAQRWTSTAALHRTRSALHTQAAALAHPSAPLTTLVEERTTALTQANAALQQIVAHKAEVDALQERTHMLEQRVQADHALLDALPDCLVLLAPDLTLQWGNMPVRRALDPRLAAPACWCWLHSGAAQCEDCPAARTLRTGHAAQARVSRPDGRLWEISTTPLLDRHGHVTNVLELSRDVTAQVTMQDAAARFAQLASLGQLAAEVAHELTNPLNGLINYAQILREAAPAGTEEAAITGRMVTEGNRMATLMASLLSFAHAEDTKKVWVSLHALLADTLALVGRQLAHDGIVLHVHVDTTLPPVLAYEQHLAQVFLALLHNARDALNLQYPGADAGKILAIRGARVRVEGQPHIQVTFHDHGVGIPAAILPHVLEPFFSTKPRGRGTGLGLSISHRLITEHGGRLVLDSVEHAFTQVHVILPSGEEPWRSGS